MVGSQVHRFDRDGLYAMIHDESGFARCLGGPYSDIDDVLDTCWDEVLGKDRAVSAVFYIRCVEGDVVKHEFLRGTFPNDDETIDD
jgi:hypothetical protein